MENNKKLSVLRKQINNLVYEECLDKYKKNKLNYLIEEYKKIDNDQTPFVYIALAKYYLTFNNIKLALENIKIAESINPDLPSISYLKFRINIRLKDYEGAYKYLKQYEEKNKNNSKFIDLSIYYYLLNKLLNNKGNISFNNMEYINTVVINDSKFKDIWYEFRKSIFSERYSESKQLIIRLNQYCKLNGIFLNFDEIDMLINEMILRKNKIKNKKPSLDEEINCIKNLIDEDILDLAEEKLNNIKHFYDYKSKKIQIELLKRYLNEKKEINQLKESNLYEIYEKFRNDGKINDFYDDYYISYQYFTAGYYLTGINKFNFYAARSLFYLGKEKEAKQLLLEYNKKGYSKLIKSYKLLLKIKCSSKERKKLKKEYYILKSIINPEGNLEKQVEFIPQETFSSCEEDIDINTILTQFDNYNNQDKLKYIKYLYQKSYKNIADKLLKKYNNQIISDKKSNQKLLELRKNRTLYINQAKYKCN